MSLQSRSPNPFAQRFESPQYAGHLGAGLFDEADGLFSAERPPVFKPTSAKFWSQLLILLVALTLILGGIVWAQLLRGFP